MRQLERFAFGNVDRSAEADRGVDQEAHQCADRALGLRLQHEIGENQGFAQVAEEVAQTQPEGLRYAVLVAHRSRPKDCAIQLLMNRVHVTVEFFERIAGRMANVPWSSA